MTTSPHDRLRQARANAGFKSAAEFAAAAGVQEGTYRHHENGIRGFPAAAARRYAAKLGVTANWILFGDGDSERDHADEDTPFPGVQKGALGLKARAKNPSQDHHSTSPVPEIDVRAGMGSAGGESLLVYKEDGNGGMVETDAIAAMWELPPDYLHRELRVRKGAARIIEVQGDSMEPTLLTGDRVMVHLQDRIPSPPGIFAVWDGFGVVVKRLEIIPNSDPPCIVLASDNQKHRTYERAADEVNVIGRVVWFARRM